jgi:hypothetical protein
MRTNQRAFIEAVIVAMLLLFCFAGPATADPFNHLSLSSDILGGATTAPTSGVSRMYVNRSTAKTYISAVNDGPCRTVQVKDIDYSQVQQAAGGTVAGTFSLWAAWSLDENDFGSGETIYFYKDHALTGITNNTVAPVTRAIPPGGFLQYYFGTSGATGFDKAHILERGGEMGAGFAVSYPLPLSHATDDFAATGITPFTTSFTVPAGCNCVEVQATGTDWAYSSPTESGVSKIVGENKVLLMPVGEFSGGSFGPGAGAAGAINAQFWTECPPK